MMMGWLWVVWLCIGVLIWRLVGTKEWSIPLGWQQRLADIVEKTRRGQQIYECIWQVNPENPLAEWYLWKFPESISELDSKRYANCYIETEAGLRGSVGMDTYLACLKRRFPEIEISFSNYVKNPE